MQRTYVTTLEHPNCVFNNVRALTHYIASREDADDHVHIMAEYSLDYVLPSMHYARIIDHELESKGLEWRIHSCHARVSTETIRIILRRVGLADLTAENTPLSVHDTALYPIMRKYSEQFCEGGVITGSSNIVIFKSDTGFYYLYTRVFDMWAYDDACPDIGWRPVDEEDIRENTP